MWPEKSHRRARREPLKSTIGVTLSSEARRCFSCPPVERHHRGVPHFEQPVIKQCIRTSNQSTFTVPLSSEMKARGNARGHLSPVHRSYGFYGDKYSNMQDVQSHPE
ncbi:hypothetical protein XENOCAPTIV_016922 [Xenoophorus captivus]|uniref:Uncharacterized protein n=1 Tax=Xenoophorus captivus TaxID=1517983 RepID=A0ABV0S2N9_9TELE